MLLLNDAEAAAKIAVATLIAFCSTYSFNCLRDFSFSLHFLYIHYLGLRFYWSTLVSTNFMQLISVKTLHYVSNIFPVSL